MTMSAEEKLQFGSLQYKLSRLEADLERRPNSDSALTAMLAESNLRLTLQNDLQQQLTDERMARISAETMCKEMAAQMDLMRQQLANGASAHEATRAELETERAARLAAESRPPEIRTVEVPGPVREVPAVVRQITSAPRSQQPANFRAKVAQRDGNGNITDFLISQV